MAPALHTGRATSVRSIAMIVMFAVAGCATPPAATMHPAMTTRESIDAAGRAYDKPGVTAAQRERDEGECAKVAVSGPGAAIGVALPYSFDRGAFAACMRGRGNVVRDLS